MLIGRWKPQQIRIWSLAYVRFWIVKTLIRSNPLVLFVGSPLYVLYLRALGAKIGRGVVIFSRHVPVCTDLLTIGDGTVIRKDSFFTCYRAHAGLIQTGPVTLGRDVFVGEATVLDIDTSLGDGAQLGHASSLHAGRRARRRALARIPGAADRGGLPDGRPDRLRHPATGRLRRPAAADRAAPVRAAGDRRRRSCCSPRSRARRAAGPRAARRFTSWTFYLDALAISLVLFFGSVLVGLLVVVTVPRVLNLAIKPDKVYPLYGFHYWVHRAIARMTNIRFFDCLFGDSSYIVHYLRWLGYDLSPVVQTGSNFGCEVKHETPYLSSVGSGTMVADGLSIINADFSSTSFRVSRASIGPTQLPREQRRLSLAGQDGRQLPARDEGDGSDRRGDPGGRRAAGLAQLRDSAVGRARQPVRPPEERGRAAPPPCRQEQVQRRHHGAVPAGAVDLLLRGHRARLGRRRTSTPRSARR